MSAVRFYPSFQPPDGWHTTFEPPEGWHTVWCPGCLLSVTFTGEEQGTYSYDEWVLLVEEAARHTCPSLTFRCLVEGCAWQHAKPCDPRPPWPVRANAAMDEHKALHEDRTLPEGGRA